MDYYHSRESRFDVAWNASRGRGAKRKAAADEEDDEDS